MLSSHFLFRHVLCCAWKDLFPRVLTPPYLRYAEDERKDPSHHDGGVTAGHSSPTVSLQRTADGMVPVYCHSNYHVGGSKHAHNLQVLDAPAEKVWSLKPLRYVPYQLGKNLDTQKEKLSVP